MSWTCAAKSSADPATSALERQDAVPILEFPVLVLVDR
jgi:hypothetical protein